MFERAFIVGMGLIGGSLAIDLKIKRLAKEIIGYDNSLKNLNKAKNLGIIDRKAQLKEANACDLVIVAVPVLSIPPVLLSIFPMLEKNTYVFDVGSVKGYVIESVKDKLLPGINYVPLHPVAGRETSGPEAAKRDLFKNRTIIITPLKDKRWKKIEDLIKKIGAMPVYMDYRLHDKLFAISSHLPHILSFLNVDLLKEMNIGEVRLLVGSGFKDFTRIAKSNEEVWADIVIANKSCVIKAIENLIEKCIEVKETVYNNREKLVGLWREARLFREKLDE